MPRDRAEVFLSVGGKDILVGLVWSHRKNTESMTFQYDESYLAHEDAYQLDPELPLVSFAQQTSVGRKIFGAFSDSAPDRWGRRLIARNELKRVEREGGAQRTFGEFDYLIGVRDDVRQGALRFADPDSGQFVSSEDEGVPPLLELPRLLSSSANLEAGEEDEDDLAILVRGGSSLGGARPKAHVRMNDGTIAIAKFPSQKFDDWDVMRWEWVALQLAGQAGIDVPPHELKVVNDLPVLIVDRFDRNGDVRIGYSSAMTMLGLTDGDQSSYLEIAEVITNNSPRANRDLEELWRRIIFSILISNFDDHLRNHGFLRLSSAGWSLSPAFDLNPEPDSGGKGLETSIDSYSSEASIDRALDVAPAFRLNADRAIEIVREVSAATTNWRRVASSVGLQNEIRLLAPAFEHREAEKAAQIST